MFGPYCLDRVGMPLNPNKRARTNTHPYRVCVVRSVRRTLKRTVRERSLVFVRILPTRRATGLPINRAGRVLVVDVVSTVSAVLGVSLAASVAAAALGVSVAAAVGLVAEPSV